jgi:hypothetical protein
MGELLTRLQRIMRRPVRIRRMLGSIEYHFYRKIRDLNFIVDVGCGKGVTMKRMMDFGFNSRALGIDLFLPYLQECKRCGIYDELVMASATHLPIRSKVFDGGLLIDVLEHMDRSSGYAALKELERVAKRVIVYTPPRFLTQREYDDNPFQRHYSDWAPKDMRKLGYRVRGLEGFFFTRVERAEPRFKGILWEFVDLLNHLSAPLLYIIPSLAFQMLCIKETKN